MQEMPKRDRLTEEYKNLYCSITYSRRFISITILDNEDNDLIGLLNILNKYKDFNVEIRNITKLSELNKICSLLGSYDYSGKVTINLLSRVTGNSSIEGLSNNKYINLESLPSYAKIKGFYENNKQSDFSSWAHNLNINDKITLMGCLTEGDKNLFAKQERVIKAFYNEFIKEYPNIMLLGEKERFETAFMYVMSEFKYNFGCLANDGYLSDDGYYANDAVETYERRSGVCGGRSNLLTLVTNNSLLRCNSATVDGRIEPSNNYPNGLDHSWNVFICNNGRAYYYDLSFRSFTRRDIYDLGQRRIDRVFYSNVQEILSRPPLPPRKVVESEDSPKVNIKRPLPPRREEE